MYSMNYNEEDINKKNKEWNSTYPEDGGMVAPSGDYVFAA